MGASDSCDDGLCLTAPCQATNTGDKASYMTLSLQGHYPDNGDLHEKETRKRKNGWDHVGAQRVHAASPA